MYINIMLHENIIVSADIICRENTSLHDDDDLAFVYVFVSFSH
jgi:hypothetical protein